MKILELLQENNGKLSNKRFSTVIMLALFAFAFIMNVLHGTKVDPQLIQYDMMGVGVSLGLTAFLGKRDVAESQPTSATTAEAKP